MDNFDKILDKLYKGVICPAEAKYQLQDLIGKCVANCNHDWAAHSCDNYGFVNEQVCVICGTTRPAY